MNVRKYQKGNPETQATMETRFKTKTKTQLMQDVKRFAKRKRYMFLIRHGRIT